MRKEWVPAVPLLLLTYALLLWAIHVTHMRADEQLVYFFTRFDNLPRVIEVQAVYDVHPPLWISIFWTWRGLVGETEFAGRMHALLFSMLTLALTYRLGRRWFESARAGLFALALLGVNAFFIIYAVEIRHYSLLMLVGAWSMWCYQRWLTHATPRRTVWYGLSVAVMLYVHYFLGVLLLVQIAYVLLTRRIDRVRPALAAAALAAILYLPWTPALINQVNNLRQVEQAGGNARGALGIGTTTQPTSFETAAELATLITNGQVALYALILIVGFALLWRRSAYRLALAWAVGGPALSLLLNLFVAVYAQRYNAYLIVGLALAAGAALAALMPRLRVPALALTLMLTLLAVPAHLPQRIPFRDLFGQVSALAQPGDVLLFEAAGIEDRFVQWQIAQYMDPALAANRADSVEAAQTHRRVWFVTGAWFDEAVRARFSALETTHPVQDIVGDCTRAWCYLIQLMEAPPQIDSARFGPALIFRGLDLDRVTDDAIDVRLWWSVELTPAADYSIGLHLLNEAGALVAQHDGPIDDQYSGLTQASALTPDRIYIDHRRIVPPPDLPLGRYQLALTVYQPWDGVRLPVDGGADDYLMLNTITLD